MTFHAPQRRTGLVRGLFQTSDPTQFRTLPVSSLALGFDGIVDDRHGGQTRFSGGREPWYPRGTEIRNERQLSLLCPLELAGIAQHLAVEDVLAEWMGANMLIDGFPHFTLLPPRTCLFFEGGVTLRIDGLNVPCRATGRSVAKHYPERPMLDLAFVKAAKRLRGLVATVEKPGCVRVGEAVEARIPEQWIYPA
jgi:hypothetical protein